MTDAQNIENEIFLKNEKFLKNKNFLEEKKKLKIDNKTVLAYYNANTLIYKIVNYNVNNNSEYIIILFYNILYTITKYTTNFTENFIYYFNNIYNKNYSYYHIFLNLLFISILVIVAIIFYWDNIYRTAKKTSRCQYIKDIYDENEKLSSPFVYYIVIIDKEDIDSTLNKYAIKIEYNFYNNKTRIEIGDDEYAKKIISDTETDIFNYYDLDNNYSKELNNIKIDLITTNRYNYIAVDTENNVIKTEYAKNLEKFTRDYAKDTNIYLYPIYDIMNAKKLLSVI